MIAVPVRRHLLPGFATNVRDSFSAEAIGEASAEQSSLRNRGGRARLRSPAERRRLRRDVRRTREGHQQAVRGVSRGQQFHREAGPRNRWSSRAPVPSPTEDWPSGLRRTIGNRVGCNSPHGFESRILRQLKVKRRAPASWVARRFPYAGARDDGPRGRRGRPADPGRGQADRVRRPPLHRRRFPTCRHQRAAARPGRP